MNEFRFCDPANTATTRLNLLASPWTVGEGLVLGGDEPVIKVLQQPPWDGVEIASVWSGGLITMAIPLVLYKAGGMTVAEIEAAMSALNTELRRPTNAIAYRPSDVTGAAWIIDTVRSAQVSLQDGEARASQWKKRDGRRIVINVMRQPIMRGRGVMI